MQTKTKEKKENQEIENEGDENIYFRWNVDMERVLADILREERRLGNKGDGGWKTAAYNSAASILSTQFDIHVTADNIRNRVKSWKKFYPVVSDILSQSGFNWDATKKMISVDEDPAWQEYVKVTNSLFFFCVCEILLIVLILMVCFLIFYVLIGSHMMLLKAFVGRSFQTGMI